MLNKLQQIYPSIIPFDREKSESYHWFQTDNGDVFGIHQNELMLKDEQILAAFLQKYDPRLPKRTVTEQLWYDRIHGKNNTPIQNTFRFIYFEIQKNQIDPYTFHDAFNTLFERPVPILWENDAAGVIIEDVMPADDAIEFEQIIDILIADLSVNLRFFVGAFHDTIDQLPESHQGLLAMGKQLFQLTNKSVIHEIEAIPFLLVQRLTKKEKEKLTQSVLQHFEADEEMLGTLQAFFTHNLNISETAKNMYMHRNSLQYRLDKFSKETGINVQVFSEAVAVHLALLAKKGLID